MLPRKALLYVVALVLPLIGVSGLGCNPGQTNAMLGVPSLQPNASVIDFSTVLVGDAASRQIAFGNGGPAKYSIVSVRFLHADGMRHDLPISGLSIVPNRSPVAVTFTYQPIATGALDGIAEITFSNALLDQGGSTLRLALKGSAVDRGCKVVRATDYVAAVGTTLTHRLSVLNHSTLPWKVRIGDIVGGGGVFAFGARGSDDDSEVEPVSAPGTYEVPAGRLDSDSGRIVPGELPIPVDFKPAAPGAYSACIEVLEPASCAPGCLPLVGTAYPNLLTCSALDGSAASCGPSGCALDLGFAAPGTSSFGTVRFQNLGTEDAVTLQLRGITGSPSFTLDPQMSRTSIYSLEPGTSVDINVFFTPTHIGPENGWLNFSDGVSRLRQVCLTGFGGGPRVDVDLGAIDFGEWVVDNSLLRTVTVRNVGDDAPSTTADNLRFAVGKTAAEPTIEGPDARDFLVVRPVPHMSDGIAAGGSAALQVAFAPRSEGLKHATLIISTNDPQTPTTRVALTGDAQKLPACNWDAAATLLDYGEVAPGEHLDLQIVLRNLGTAPDEWCMIRDAALTGDSFGFTDQPADPVRIKPGGSVVFTVRFSPSAEGSFAGQASFTLSNPNRAHLAVPLQGAGATGCVMVLPREVVFASTPTGCTSRITPVWVFNTCEMGTTVDVDAIDLVPLAAPSFAFAAPPEVPVTLDTGSRASASVKYQPVDDGDDYGAVAVSVRTTTGGVTTSHRFVTALRGTAAAIPRQTDIFQTSRPKVDVLLVVDNSGTMAPKQVLLANNFGSFLTTLTNIDYHVAVTTTSVGPGEENGHFVPWDPAHPGSPPVRPRVMTPSTLPSPQAVFAQNVCVGTNGSGAEMLLRPVYLALSSPMVYHDNAGFLRDDATLAIVVVSDAADEVDKVSGVEVPIEFYESFLVGLKGVHNRSMITFVGIVPTLSEAPITCQYDTPTSGLNPRIRNFAARLDGTVKDICEQDWTGAFSDIGKYVVGYHTVFPLNGIPDLQSPFEVMLDDVEYPQLGPKGELRWHYDATKNAVIFDSTALPDPGVTVSVAYTTECGR